MAIVKNDPFPGTDYSSYKAWQKVTTPDGGVYYVVPGHSDYVYDEVASNASGRKVFRKNPQLQVDAYKQQQDAIKQQQFNQSPLGQIVPVAAGTGGIIAASKFTSPGATAQQITSNGILMSDGTIKPIAGALEANASTAAQGAAAAPIAADGAVAAEGGAAPAAATGIGYGPYLGAAGAALGGYGVYNAIQNNDVGAGALSGAGLGAGLASAAPLLGLGPVGWGGLALAAALGAGGGAGLTKLLGHETTRELAKKHTKQLLNSSNDPAYQGYVNSMREQYNSATPDPDHPFHAGKYGTWEEYKAAGLDPNDLTGVYGNIKTFGPEWANLTQAQRVAVTKGIIDAGLYNSRKGEVEISDATKAKEIKDNVLKGFGVGAQTGVQAGAQAAAQAAVAARSSTRSPGIGMNGQRINFGR